MNKIRKGNAHGAGASVCLWVACCAALCGWQEEMRANGIALDVAAELSHGPSGVAVAPDGSMIVAIHQHFKTRERMVRVDRTGESHAFPSVDISVGATADCPVALDAVMGVRAGEAGVIWFLDNGRRGESTPKLVAWNTNQGRIHRVLHFPAPATVESSFLADFVLHPAESFVYIVDPASGSDAAILVVDLRTGVVRRVLQGHRSVMAEAMPMVVNGQKLHARRSDGSTVEPLAGVNPVAIDRKGRFLYYGAMKGRTLYRIGTALLNDPELSAAEVEAGVEVYSEKPFCDSITIDARDNIYVGDVVRGAIQVIPPKTRKPEIYLTDPKLNWPDGLSIANDGRIYFYCNQMSRTSWFSSRDASQAPFSIFRMKPIYQPLITSPLPERNPLTGIRDRIGEKLGLD